MDIIEAHRKIFEKRLTLPHNFKILLLEERRSLSVINGVISSSYYDDSHHEIKGLKLDRGKILEAFTKIEFIINEIIKFEILGIPNENTNWKKRALFDDILEKVGFSNKLLLLKPIRKINKNIKNKLYYLLSVRNGFSHTWSLRGIEYRNISIDSSSNFSNFKQDLLEVWMYLFEIYRQYQERFDLDEILNF